MKEEIEVKRKVFTVVEQIGEHSYKVERKGQYFFQKKFENDDAKFDAFCEAEHQLRVSGVTNPKCYLYDKKLKIAVIEYVEGDTCLAALLRGELPENIIELLFKTFWYARNDRLALDYRPDNFVFSYGKLYYLPFTVSRFKDKESFIQNDIRLWFFTKEFVNYCHEKGIDADPKHIKSDYEINKTIALVTVKYYRQEILMANKTIEIIKNRVSCRSYSEKKVSLKKVLEIAEAGKFAPSGKNRQIANIYVVNSKRYVEKLRALSLKEINRDCMYGARTIILVAGPRDDFFTSQDCS